jgi:hypothetical protein
MTQTPPVGERLQLGHLVADLLTTAPHSTHFASDMDLFQSRDQVYDKSQNDAEAACQEHPEPAGNKGRATQ